MGMVAPFIRLLITWSGLSGLAAAVALPGVSVAADALNRIEVYAEDDYASVTGDVVPEEYTGFFSTVEQKTLERGSLSLGEVIDHEAGTQVRESGGFGSYSEISLRGASSEQVMIYLDGLLLNEGAGGGVDLSAIDLSQISQIHIYRGNTPIQLGKASFGGAVNILTHRQSAEPTAQISITLGDFATRKLAATYSATRGRLDGLVSLGLASSNNDFEYVNDMATQFNREDDEKQKRQNARADQHSALIKSAWRFSDDLRLDNSLQLFDKAQGVPAWNNHPDVDASLETQSWQLRSKLTADGFYSDEVNNNLEFFISEKEETYDDRDSKIGLNAQHDKYDTETLGLKGYSEWIGEESTAGVSLDIRKEEYQRKDLLATKKNDESRRLSAAASIQYNRFFKEESWLISPSVRMQWFKNRYRLDDQMERNDQSSQFTSPQLGVQFHPSEDITLKANLGKYVREPSFFELFGDRGLFVGNEELNAEEGRNLDIGVQWRKQNPLRGVQSSRLQISAWHNEIDQMIARTYNARGIGRSQNIAAARLRGLEFSLRMVFKNGFSANSSLTLQDPENRSDNAAFQGKSLPGRAEKTLFISFNMPLGKWSFLYELDIQRDRYYDTANLLKAENRELHNLRIERELAKNFSLALEVKNLGDKNFEDFNGFPKPGRAWYLTLNYKH